MSLPCTETIRLRTTNRFLRDVQKGATLPDGGTGGVPQRKFIPFPKRKGIKGMVGTFIKTFVELNNNFLYKAGVSAGALKSPSRNLEGPP